MAEWKDGDIITADSINSVEDRLSQSGGFFVLTSRYDESTHTLTNTELTYDEIVDRIANNYLPILIVTYPDATSIGYPLFLTSNKSVPQTLWFIGADVKNFLGFMISTDGSVTEF